MELREKIKNFLRRTFTPWAYKREQLFKQLSPHQKELVEKLKGATAHYQDVYDSRSGFSHLADPTDLRDAIMRIMVLHQACRDEQIPQTLIDHYTPSLILHQMQKNGYPRVIPTGQGMAS